MQRAIRYVILITTVMLAGCATAQPPASDLKDPTVTLTQVIVQNYYAPPWTGWPANPPTPTPNPSVITPTAYIPFPGAISVPMVIAFVFDVNNPNDQPVTLERLQFDMGFEAAPMKPGEFFNLNHPIAEDRQSIPGKTTNQVRVVTVIDSAVVPGNLAVTSGQRLNALGLSGAALVQSWWVNIPDMKFGIKVTSGTADFSSGAVKKVVTFEGKFPK
jgi:hypothetical protein